MYLPVVCVSRAGLELASGGTEVLLVSQCNMVWRIFVQAEGSGCWSFAYSWCFYFCQVWLQCLSKIFDLWSSCCLLPLSILDPLCNIFIWVGETCPSLCFWLETKSFVIKAGQREQWSHGETWTKNCVERNSRNPLFCTISMLIKKRENQCLTPLVPDTWEAETVVIASLGK
jgi:hypothetical protein